MNLSDPGEVLTADVGHEAMAQCHQPNDERGHNPGVIRHKALRRRYAMDGGHIAEPQ